MMLRGRIGNQPVPLEPYEAGWASEALAFVCVHRMVGEDARLSVTLEISPDGMRWVPHSPPFELTPAGNYRFQLAAFGNWLRATLCSTGEALADFYWVFK